MARTKNEAAEWLAQADAEIDPGVVRTIRLRTRTGGEDDVREPIKLLEVNEHSTGTGVLPLFFGPEPESGVESPIIIVQVMPEEYGDILAGQVAVPNDWQLGEMVYERSAMPLCCVCTYME